MLELAILVAIVLIFIVIGVFIRRKQRKDLERLQAEIRNAGTTKERTWRRAARPLDAPTRTPGEPINRSSRYASRDDYVSTPIVDTSYSSYDSGGCSSDGGSCGGGGD